MGAIVSKIGKRKLALIVAAIGAAIVDQIAGTDLLGQVLPLLVGM